MRADRSDPEITLSSVIQGLRPAAYLLCGSWPQADDLLQVTAIKLHRKLHTIQDMRALPGFAHQTMYRTFLDQLRRDRRRKEVLHADVPEQVAPEQPRRDEAIASAVAALPPRQRACVVLRYFEDRSIDEVAALMEIDPGTVKSQTKRALDALRITLDPDEAALLERGGGS